LDIEIHSCLFKELVSHIPADLTRVARASC